MRISATLSLFVVSVLLKCRSIKGEYEDEVSKLLEFCENQATEVEDYFVDYLTVCSCKVGEAQLEETAATTRANEDGESSVSAGVTAATMTCMDGCQACVDMGNNVTYCAYRDMEATIILSTETSTGFRITESCHITSRDVTTQQRMCSDIELENSGSFLDALESAMSGMPKLIIQCPKDEEEHDQDGDDDQDVAVEEQTKEPFSYNEDGDDDDEDGISVIEDDACKQTMFDLNLVLFGSILGIIVIEVLQ